jgi:hypothetical protein
LNLNQKEGFLHILVRANLKEDPKVTGSAHALFVKGFYIKEPGKVRALFAPCPCAWMVFICIVYKVLISCS